jgi:hypothetical protein
MFDICTVLRCGLWLTGVTERTPRIQFLECMVYVVADPSQPRLGLLVEPMLDPTKYMKWNTNAGYVEGQVVDANQPRPLLPLLEGEPQDICFIMVMNNAVILHACSTISNMRMRVLTVNGWLPHARIDCKWVASTCAY